MEAKGEKDGFMLISLRTGLFVILILRAPTICVSVGYSLGAGDGVWTKQTNFDCIRNYILRRVQIEVDNK